MGPRSGPFRIVVNFFYPKKNCIPHDLPHIDRLRTAIFFRIWHPHLCHLFLFYSTRGRFPFLPGHITPQWRVPPRRTSPRFSPTLSLALSALSTLAVFVRYCSILVHECLSWRRTRPPPPSGLSPISGLFLLHSFPSSLHKNFSRPA